jgi:hypothetical protein
MVQFINVSTDQLVHNPEIKCFITHYSDLHRLGRIENHIRHHIRLKSHITSQVQVFKHDRRGVDSKNGIHYWQYVWMRDDAFPQLKGYWIIVIDDSKTNV